MDAAEGMLCSMSKGMFESSRYGDATTIALSLAKWQWFSNIKDWSDDQKAVSICNKAQHPLPWYVVLSLDTAVLLS